MAEDKTSKTSKPKDEAESSSDDDFFINDSTDAQVNADTDEKADSKDKRVEDEPKADKSAGEPSGKDLEQAMDEAEKESVKPVENKPVTPSTKRKWSRKKIALIVTGVIVALIAILMIIPVTRYAIAGVVIKRDVTVTLNDSKTDKPVSSVAVSLGGVSATTDAKGQATLKSVPVGSKQLKASKKHYKDATTELTVPITGANPAIELDIEATGRQVPIKVTNKVSKQPVEGAQITVDGTSSKTDKNGDAIIVLPADKAEFDATLSLNGYNNLTTKVAVTEQKDDKNTFALTPAGKLYFLSKRSGKIDVLSSNMDGTDVQTVLAGTGKEEDGGTTLLASRDWKYLALLSRRDSDREKLYLINTTQGNKLSVIDEGNITFNLRGWSNDSVIYHINRNDVKYGDPKQDAIKGYNAQSGKLTTIAESEAEQRPGGPATQYLEYASILQNEIVYSARWYGNATGKKSALVSVRSDGSQKRTIREFEYTDSYYAQVYKPNEMYVRWAKAGNEANYTYFEYEGGQLKDIDKATGEAGMNNNYITYLVSPSNNKTAWIDERDGKSLLFVGNASGNDGKQLLTLSEFKVYGWLSDDYILLTKKGSELFVVSASNPGEPLKITDYHKPLINYYGYGYGYGGF